MTPLFRSKSCGIARFPESLPDPFSRRNFGGLEAEEKFCGPLRNPVSTPCIASGSGFSGEERARDGDGIVRIPEFHPDPVPRRNCGGQEVVSTPCVAPGDGFSGEERGREGNQSAILDILVAALRKSVVTCGVEAEDVSAMEIGWPSEVRHVSHVTFDRFNGFLGLPSEFEPEIPRKVPSASAKVFGVCANSMQCTYDDKGNSVPTILLMMQKRLYVEGGLKAEGIFRINAENSQEEYVRDQLNNGIVPRGIDVHCLAGLIKAWFRELPSGVLDSLTPEQVMLCNTEDDCSQLVKSLPPTEAALLDWAINLMADVVEHEQYNKMNARNIAMVFAPNMTQMADPLTALIHAVQVMNFLKTLIVKKLNEREQSVARKRLISTHQGDQRENSMDIHAPDDVAPSSGEFLRSATMSGLEFGIDESYSSVKRKNNEADEPEIGDGNGDWLSLRRGVRRLCRHPVFQLGKSGKKGQDIEIVNNRGADNWGYI